MGSSVLDSDILRHLWGTDEIYAVFDDSRRIQGWLDFEAALALEQGEMGIIPKEAAEEIARRCKVEEIDLAEVGALIRKIKHRLMPVLKAVASKCRDGHGEWIHFGATSQDCVDTAAMLQNRQAHAIIMRDFEAVTREVLRLAETYRDAPMVGRTHGVHALPITFGHKCAIWLRELARHHERLTAAEPRVFVGSLVGAVGTMSALGPRGFELEGRVMKRLGLGQADISFAPSRDRQAEYATLLGLLAGTLTKIATEIFLLQRDEIGELEEPFSEGKVGSSTMPHKRNPTVLENIAASGRVVRYNVSMMVEAMVQENERDGIAWKTEWKALPEICMQIAGMLSGLKFVLSGLVVNTDRMRANLGLLGGVLVSERLMFALAPAVGKQTAHEMVYEASMAARTSGRPIEDVILEDPRIAPVLTEEAVREALDPTTYIGLAVEHVDRALDLTRAEGWPTR